jgi:hypothetical protein
VDGSLSADPRYVAMRGRSKQAAPPSWVPHDEHVLRGGLTCDPGVLGDARLAQLIETGAVPPLERLLDAASDAPAA